MKICPVGAELFHTDGRMLRQTGQSQQSLFAILRTSLKMNLHYVNIKFRISMSGKRT